MKKRGRTDLFLILCGILIWFLTDAARIRAQAAEALLLCGKSVIPALFPFLVVSSLLIALGFGEWVSPYLAGLMTPLFRLPGLASSALLLGLVGGYPIGAQTAADLYRQHLLTRQEAERLLTFCNNSNPVFLISVLGVGVFGSVRTGVALWLVHVLSALLVGLLFRGHGKTADRRQAPSIACRAVSLPAALVAAVRNSAGGMLSVCAFVTLFYVVAAPLEALGPHLGTALVGVVELFSLTPLLTPDFFGFVLAAGCAGWGGLSVLCQTAAVLEGTELALRPCLLGKLAQGLLSALLAVPVWAYLL
ncbi:sporulation protein [Oscillibacter valericigenes]|uniref:nucleoside recognition domain-containing protein n=1 Tax=Oscillibacter valericigenes TaxID=351091 RepID=UPI001F280648|nr:nucleoside recognition domain-containing protein [Oscillibacter valericigenes]MCF2664947.1 sporulation protein [Oscillibacter valericigenes]